MKDADAPHPARRAAPCPTRRTPASTHVLELLSEWLLETNVNPK
jgi:hypothetical protein